MRLASSPIRRLLGAAFGTALALASLAAQAGFQSDITVMLIAPGGTQDNPAPINEQQVVTVGNLMTGVQYGDNGAIGGDGSNYGWMLAGEAITFVGDSIRVRSYAGYDDLGSGGSSITTGYLGTVALGPARYEFHGLSILGKTITGFNVSVFDNFADSGIVGLASPSASSLVQQISADAISLDLSSILFVNRNTGTSTAHADFRIDLITQDNGGDPGNNLPEPATLALFAIAALGARAARRHG